MKIMHCLLIEVWMTNKISDSLPVFHFSLLYRAFPKINYLKTKICAVFHIVTHSFTLSFFLLHSHRLFLIILTFIIWLKMILLTEELMVSIIIIHYSHTHNYYYYNSGRSQAELTCYDEAERRCCDAVNIWDCLSLQE